MSTIFINKVWLRQELDKAVPDWAIIFALCFKILDLSNELYKVFKLLYYTAFRNKKGIEKLIYK